MTSPRSRRASQAQTRSSLLAVAEEILAEQGYQRASLEKIAERAGFTKGAVYSNFASKEDLTLAVLDSHFENFLNDLQQRLGEAAPTVEARVEALAGWWRDIVLHERWGVVILELAGATRDRPAFQAALTEREQMIFDFCTFLVQSEIDRFGLELDMSARQIAEALVTMGIGIAFARSLDPNVSAEILSSTAKALMVR